MTDMTELGRRAVAYKGWKWMPGMSDLDGDRFVAAVQADGIWPDMMMWWSDEMSCPISKPANSVPDLTDAATLGCLLALVCERYREGTSVIMDGDGRYYVMFISIPIASGDTAAEALVAALEAKS